MIKIDTDEIDKAFKRFCDIMGYPCNTLWRGILEFSVFTGFNVFSDPRNPPLYPHDIKRKVDAVLGPHGPTIIRAYKVRRNTTIGQIWALIKKCAHATTLLSYMGFVTCRHWWTDWRGHWR